MFWSYPLLLDSPFRPNKLRHASPGYWSCWRRRGKRKAVLEKDAVEKARNAEAWLFALDYVSHEVHVRGQREDFCGGVTMDRDYGPKSTAQLHYVVTITHVIYTANYRIHYTLFYLFSVFSFLFFSLHSIWFISFHFLLFIKLFQIFVQLNFRWCLHE